ncbi:hypothetical protein ACQ4PT_062961 [Festuca glaucescens]
MAKLRDAVGGAAVDMSDLLNAFANDVVCHAVSGKSFRKQGHNKLFRELVKANSSLIGGFNLEDYFPALVKLDVVKRMVCAKARRVNKMWDDLLDSLIDDHAASEHGGGEDSDFIDVLLSVQQEYNLTKDHIKAQLAIMFEAGIDTSSIVLEYAMVRLMQNPHLMAKLQAEVRSTIPHAQQPAVPGTHALAVLEMAELSPVPRPQDASPRLFASPAWPGLLDILDTNLGLFDMLANTLAFVNDLAAPISPPLCTPPVTTAPKSTKPSKGDPTLRSSWLAAKPSAGLATMDKVKLVLLKKHGVDADEANPKDALKKYNSIYKQQLPPEYIKVVASLVDTAKPGRKGGAPAMQADVAAA